MRRKELIGVIRSHARGVLTDDGGRRLPVYIDRRRSFIDRSKAGRDNYRGGHAHYDEGEDAPLVAAKDPKIMGQRDDRLFSFRLGIPVGGLERDVFGHGRNVGAGLRSGKCPQ